MPNIPEFIYHSLPSGGDFVTNPNLPAKVGDDGSLKPFVGDTTVFLLDSTVMLRLKKLQDTLYDHCGEMLCGERLKMDTFHMTLHDLFNNGETRFQKAPYTLKELQACLETIRRDYPDPIVMHATQMFSMVNTSIVLGLVPENDQMEGQLNEMYAQLEHIFPLNRGLTPHITLAYYKPGCYSENIWSPLRGLFQPLDLKITLTADQLVLQTFENMNSYTTVQEVWSHEKSCYLLWS